MTYADLAALVPSRFRKEILTKNHIYKSVVKWDDADMMRLWFYWKNFIEPDNEMYDYEIREGRIVAYNNCLICLRNLRDKWVLLEPYLIALEREQKMLNELK